MRLKIYRRAMRLALIFGLVPGLFVLGAIVIVSPTIPQHRSGSGGPNGQPRPSENSGYSRRTERFDSAESHEKISSAKSAERTLTTVSIAPDEQKNAGAFSDGELIESNWAATFFSNYELTLGLTSWASLAQTTKSANRAAFGISGRLGDFGSVRGVNFGAAIAVTDAARGSLAPLAPAGTAKDFSANADLTNGANYTPTGVPNNTNDVRLTSATTALVTNNPSTINMESLSVTNGLSYTINNNANGNNKDSTINLGNSAGFTNFFSGIADDLIYLTGSSNLTFGAGAVNNTLTLALASSGNFNIGSGSTLTVNSVISESGGSRSITKTGGGLAILSGANTFTGGVTIDGGILNAAVIANGGSASSIGQASNAAGNLVFGGGTLQYTGATARSTDRLFTIGDANGNTATLDASGGSVGTLSFTNGGSILFGNTSAHTLILTGINTGINTLAARIGDNTGVTSVTKSGGGTWVLSGNSSYTGGTTVSDGLLQLNSSTALGSVNGALQVDGVLNLNGNSVGVGNLSGGSTGKIWNNGPSNAVTFTIGNGNNGGGTYAGVIANNNGAGSGTVALTKTGSGTITLTGSNTYTGATAINNGTLGAGGAGALGSGTTGTSQITIANSGTLLLSGSSSVTDRINNNATMFLNGGTFNTGGLSERGGTLATPTTGIGALTLTATSTINFGSGNTSIIEFTGLGTHTAGAILQITNWDGTPVTGGGTERLLFAGLATSFTTMYLQTEVSFNGMTGYAVDQFTGFYEVTALAPVPEPSTWAAGLLAVAAVVYSQRRRFARR
jgi:fibronectin-binding autotransporter adhesin